MAPRPADPAASKEARISEARWRQFLDETLTPRFPDGLTVGDGYGQWRGRGQAGPGRLRSKILLILHDDTPSRHRAWDQIRQTWKAVAGAHSVLLVTIPAEVCSKP